MCNLHSHYWKCVFYGGAMYPKSNQKYKLFYDFFNGTFFRSLCMQSQVLKGTFDFELKVLCICMMKEFYIGLSLILLSSNYFQWFDGS